MSYRFADSLWAGSGWNSSSILILLASLFLEGNSTCFGQFLCPSSGDFHCTHSKGICQTGLLIACKQDQDGTPVPSPSCSQAYFWKENLHVSDSSSVHHQEIFTVHIAKLYVIQVCWQLVSRIRMEVQFHPHPARKLIFGRKLYMFRTVPLSIIRRFSLYT